MYYTTLSF